MTYSTSARTFAAALLLTASTSVFAQETEDVIVVTASPLGRSIDEAITGVSVLTGDALSDRLAATIGETLKLEPGVSSSFFGAGASRPIIRGQGGDRVRVLTNGIGSIDASSASPDHAVAAEPAQAERIEVLRGASLLRYGSSGSGGIVNIMDGRIPDTVPEKVSGAVRIGASSVDAGRDVAGAIDYALSPNLVLHLDGTWRESDDYKIPGEAESAVFHALEHSGDDDHEDEGSDGGALDNSFAKSKSVSGGLSYVGQRGFIGAAVHRFESTYGIPGGHAHEEGEPEEGHEAETGVSIGLEQTRLDINGALDFDGAIERVQIFGGAADYTHTEFEAPGVAGTVFANKGYEGRIEAIQSEKTGWSAAYGLQLRKREFSALGDEAFVPPTETQQIGAYMFHEKEVGDVHLEGAARYERTNHKDSANDVEKDFDLMSVSGGGDIHLSDTVRIGGTVFRTERAPTSEELFSNGPHLATSQFEKGDADLGKETAKGIEAAFRHRAGGHFVTLNLFYTDYSDYIYEADFGAEEDGLPVYQFTAEDAVFKGMEVQGGYDIASWGSYDISVDALAEYVRAETDSGNLPRIPPLSILSGIEAENDIFKFRAEVDYAAKQKKLAGGEIPTDDYAMVNVFAMWRAPVSAQPVDLKLSVLNLFNVDARQHTSFLKDVVPLPGRNIRFSISTSF